MTTPRPRRGSYTSSQAFSRRDRQLLYLAAGGRCQLCGIEVHLDGANDPTKMVAGHVKPRILGGAAVLSNGRCECWRCSTSGGAELQFVRRKPRRPAPPPWQDPDLPVEQREALYWQHVAAGGTP